MNLGKQPANLQVINLPGCFSANSVFWSAESKVCSECGMGKVCGGGRSDSRFDEARHNALIASLPVKAGKVLNTLFKNENAHVIRAAIKRKENPLRNHRPKFLSVALDELIDGGFDKRTLRNAFVSRLSCTEKTAFGWVSITVPVLSALDVVREIQGFYRIKHES